MTLLGNITLGQFAPRNSPIHRLDPRTKILSISILMISIISYDRFEILAGSFLITMLLFLSSKLSISLALKNIRPFVFLFLLTICLHAFMTSGHTWLSIPYTSLTISREGLGSGLFYTLRIMVLIMLASLLTLTTSPMSLSDAVAWFFRPLKRIGLPGQEISLMISIALRFIPIFVEESERIRKAQISRGMQVKGSISARIKAVLPLIVPLFIATFRKANELALAMDARCYRSEFKRTSYYSLKFKLKDYLALSGCIFISAAPLLYGQGNVG